MLYDNGAPKNGVLKNDLITLWKSNTIRCKKLATIVSGRKKGSMTLRQAKTGKRECRNVTACWHSCWKRIVWLTKVRATFFRLEKIVASFLHLMVLLFKMLSNHSSKRQFLVLHCRTWRRNPQKYFYILKNKKMKVPKR